MSNLPQIVSDFSPISLSEMDDVKLMRRTDTKFAFKASKMQVLLKQLLPFYKVLTIDGETIHDTNLCIMIQRIENSILTIIIVE